MTTPEPDDWDDFEDDFEDEYEEFDEDCHGWFDDGVFVCGAVGSEQCDECSCHAWLGLTNEQIDELEGIGDG